MSNAEENHTKILAFLAGVFALENHQMCVRLTLEYAPPQQFRREPLRSWTPESHAQYFAKEQNQHVFTAQLAAEVMEIAEGHADSFGAGQRHRFNLKSFQHLGSQSSCAFVCLPGFAMEVDGGDMSTAIAAPMNPDGTVPGGVYGVPGARGSGGGDVAAQLMRHLENRDRANTEMMRTFLGAMAGSMQQLREENSELRKQITEGEKQRREAAAQIEEARSKDHDRQVEAANVTAKNERANYTMKKIMALLPVALSGFVSKTAKTGKPSPLTIHMAKLFDSLSDAQREKIESVLDVEQKINLGAAVKIIEEGGPDILLPTIVHDMVETLRAPQIQAVFSVLDEGQRKAFLELMNLARAQADRQSVEANENKSEPEPEPAA